MKETDITTPLDRLRRSFRSGRTRPLQWRLEQLRRLRAMLVERERDFLEALRADLGKGTMEGWGTEVGFSIAELDHATKNLRRWMKPQRASTPMIAQLGKSRIVYEPLGTVLIIAPWNYPLQLAVAPLIAAIAAGNCAVIKPSEVASHTAGTLARWIPAYLDPDCVTVIQGGVPETTALLAEPFDFIFYTGGGTVGRIVMTAAAKHLTPVVLELGGKSPCIVAEDANMQVTARRIAWGKFLNAGQTCVAADYILVHQSKKAELIERLAQAVHDFYGDDPSKSPDLGRIINEHHFQRLQKLLDSGETVCGGEHDAGSLYMAPTLLDHVEPEAPVMQEEIFGPILPIIAVGSMDEAIDFVNARPKPLALYIFSESRRTVQKVIGATSSGGVAVNDIAVHLGVPGLPFGGVGESGMGAYHGRYGFEAFSHRKSVYERSTKVDPSVRYPPYTPSKISWIKRLM